MLTVQVVPVNLLQCLHFKYCRSPSVCLSGAGLDAAAYGKALLCVVSFAGLHPALLQHAVQIHAKLAAPGTNFFYKEDDFQLLQIHAVSKQEVYFSFILRNSFFHCHNSKMISKEQKFKMHRFLY